MTLPTPQALADALARRPLVEHPALPGRRNHLRAGVITPLRWTDGRLETLVQLRPPRLRRHGGEISFPGGRPEPEDVDLEATARRETREEMGLTRLEVLGRLSSMPLYTSDYRLEPFVARVDPTEPVRPDPSEVAEVLTLDLGEILASGVVEGIDSRAGGWVLPIFRPGGHVMYGATAITLLELLGVVAEVMDVAVPEVEVGGLTWEALLGRDGSGIDGG